MGQLSSRLWRSKSPRCALIILSLPQLPGRRRADSRPPATRCAAPVRPRQPWPRHSRPPASTSDTPARCADRPVFFSGGGGLSRRRGLTRSPTGSESSISGAWLAPWADTGAMSALRSALASEVGRRCPRRAIRHRSPKGVIGAGAGVCRALREDGGGAVGEVGAGLAHAHGLWGRGESTRVAAA